MKTSVAARNGQVDNLTARLNSGYLRIYSGTKPANVAAALAGNTLLAELRFASTAFGAAANGSAAANTITSDSAADATGTATFARLFGSDGTTAVVDVGVGATSSGAELELNTTSIVANATVAVSSCTISQADGT